MAVTSLDMEGYASSNIRILSGEPDANHFPFCDFAQAL